MKVMTIERMTRRLAALLRSQAADARAATALALLLALSAGGFAHASRLCGIAGHPSSSSSERAATPSTACAAGEHQGHHGATPPADRTAHHGDPRHDDASDCCLGGGSLAALPSAKLDGPDRTVVSAPLPAVLAAGPGVLDLRGLRATSDPWPPRDARSGPRRHLVQRVLLI